MHSRFVIIPPNNIRVCVFSRNERRINLISLVVGGTLSSWPYTGKTVLHASSFWKMFSFPFCSASLNSMYTRPIVLSSSHSSTLLCISILVFVVLQTFVSFKFSLHLHEKRCGSATEGLSGGAKKSFARNDAPWITWVAEMGAQTTTIPETEMPAATAVLM